MERVKGTLRVVVMAMMVLLLFGAAIASAKVTISVSTWGGGDALERYQAEIAAFEKAYPDIEVNLMYYDWSVYAEKLTVLAAGNALPDLVMCLNSKFEDFARNGLFTDLRPFMARDLDGSSLVEENVMALTIDGEVLGLPTNSFQLDGPFLMYSTILFDGAGVSYPNPDWQWEKEFLVASQKLSRDRDGDGSTDQWGSDCGQIGIKAGFWEQILRGYGGDIYDEAGTKFTIDTPQAREVFTFLNSLVVDYDVALRPNSWFMVEQKTAMSINWLGTYNFLKTKMEGVRASVLPKGPVSRGLYQNTASPTHCYAIAANSQHKEAAWKLLKFLLTSPDALKARRLGYAEGLAWRPNIPLWLDIMAEEGLDDVAQAQEVMINEIVREFSLEKQRLGRLYREFRDSWHEEMESYYAGDSSLGAALANMQRIADNAVAEAQASK